MILWPAREILDASRRNGQKAFKQQKICVCKYCGLKFRKITQLGAHVSNNHKGNYDKTRIL